MDSNNSALEKIRDWLKYYIPDDECNIHLRDTHWIPDIMKFIEKEKQKAFEFKEKEWATFIREFPFKHPLENIDEALKKKHLEGKA
jgi:hypothetical protein